MNVLFYNVDLFYNSRSQKLMTLARGLSPGYVRFGGTRADFVLFEPSNRSLTPREDGESIDAQGNCPKPISFEDEEYLKYVLTSQEPFVLREQFQNDFKNITISGRSIDILHSFANCSGLHLIFGLNALLRKKHAWDSSNAQELLKYCASKQYNVSWELGNEPNSFRKKAHIKIQGSQLGKDFQHLYKLLKTYSAFSNTGIYGPDIGQPRRNKIVNLLKGLVTDCATTFLFFPSYYVNGRNTSLKDFLSPAILDSLRPKVKEVFQVVAKTVAGKKVWLGETSSAFGGGAPDLSNKYVAGFMWLDKLGLSAKLGIDVVVRQALFGAGYYQLLDKHLNPLPDYWLSLIYKKIVGTEVLDVNIVQSDEADDGKLRVYMHCTKKNSEAYGNGSVTMFAINLSDKDKYLCLCESLCNKTIQQFLLEPGDRKAGLYSQSVRLNDEVLSMVDRETLPVIRGKQLAPGSIIRLPGFSYAFYVIQDAKAPACQRN
uniref:Heparanase n=1 Tax=Callorhinchus milii TaxID=7868 RepID=A0A4W3JI07_CALMI